MNKQTCSTTTALPTALPNHGGDWSDPTPAVGSPTPLALLPIDDIAPQPMEYLGRRGVPVRRYAYRALSDIGLGNPVIRYRIEHGDRRPPTTLIAKWHEPDDGPALASLLQALWQNGFAGADQLCVPELLGYIPDQHILLQAEASGEPLYSRLAALSESRATTGDTTPSVRLAGRWLAKLHAMRDSRLQARSPVEDASQSIGKVQRHCAELAARFPSEADRLTQIAQAIQASLIDSPVEPVPTHGDFHPKNIYVASKRVTVIDFDRFAYSRPERDLGYFMAQSMTMAYTPAMRFQASAIWNAEFLAAYAAAGRSPDLAALGAYTGIAFLEVLFYRLVVRPVAEHAFLSDWLAECEHLIAEPHRA